MPHVVTEEDIAMLDEKVRRARAAAEVIATYDQQRVDRLCQAVAAAVANATTWAELCDESVDETRLGDKVTKRNKRTKLKLILRECMRQKSVGMIEYDPVKGISKYAKPVGVICSLVPTTNPCLTPAGQALYAIKARDVIICSPHPRAKVVTNKCINIIRDALVKEGAPADIIQGIENPNISLTQELMKRCDLVIATGGRPMVKSAYSSGVPAYGSGAGNATVIYDDTCNTPEFQRQAAENTRISKTADFGSGCSCDGNLVIAASVYDGCVKALKEQGGYLITNKDDEKKIMDVLWDETGHRLPDTVAIAPQKIGELAGVEIPADAKFIMITGGGMEGIGADHFFSKEKLTTLLTLFKYDDSDFQNAIDMVLKIFNEAGGKGHSCGIYSWNDQHIDALASVAPVSRMMVRQPNNKGNSGSPFNGMPPTSSMSCGTWGGNIITENITLKHYMNITWVARPIMEDLPSSKALLGDFYDPNFDVELKK